MNTQRMLLVLMTLAQSLLHAAPGDIQLKEVFAYYRDNHKEKLQTDQPDENDYKKFLTWSQQKNTKKKNQEIKNFLGEIKKETSSDQQVAMKIFLIKLLDYVKNDELRKTTINYINLKTDYVAPQGTEFAKQFFLSWEEYGAYHKKEMLKISNAISDYENAMESEKPNNNSLYKLFLCEFFECLCCCDVWWNRYNDLLRQRAVDIHTHMQNVPDYPSEQ